MVRLFPHAMHRHAYQLDKSGPPRAVWRAGHELFACLASSIAAGENDNAPFPQRLSTPNQVAARPGSGRGALMWAPLVDDQGCRGLLVVEGRTDADEFTTEELCALVSIASLVAAKLRSFGDPSSRRRDHDLAAAHRVQRLISTVPTELDGFRMSCEYRPHFEVGGDFFDVRRTGDRKLTAIVGDVSGKGAAAAMVMARVAAEFRHVSETVRDPAELLGQLNVSLGEYVPDDTFVTAVCVCYDARRGRLKIANAGHYPPLLKHKSGGVTFVGRTTSTPLGMVANQSYKTEEIIAKPGDILLLVTDGVTDTLDPRRGLGAWRLADIVAHAPHDVGEIRRLVLDEVNRGGARDDVALLAIQDEGDDNHERFALRRLPAIRARTVSS
jgi:serine phosphatase RsbU (regulator of sigma subunit)